MSAAVDEEESDGGGTETVGKPRLHTTPGSGGGCGARLNSSSLHRLGPRLEVCQRMRQAGRLEGKVRYDSVVNIRKDPSFLHTLDPMPDLW